MYLPAHSMAQEGNAEPATAHSADRAEYRGRFGRHPLSAQPLGRWLSAVRALRDRPDTMSTGNATFIAPVRHDSLPGSGYSCGPSDGVSCTSGPGVDGLTRGWRRWTVMPPLTGGRRRP